MNLYLFRLARVLHPYRSDGEIVETLRAVTAGCGRIVTEMEIQRAVQNSRSGAWRLGERNGGDSVPPWPMCNPEQREAVLEAADRFGLVDLWEGSPVRFEDNLPHTEEIVDALFPGGALLCCAKSTSEFATRARETWRGELAAMQLIVPSPMLSRTGHTQDGRSPSTLWRTRGGAASSWSSRIPARWTNRRRFSRTLRNVRHWRWPCTAGANHYMVGFSAPANARNVASIHALRGNPWRGPCNVDALAVLRMPDGTSEDGKRQTVYFFNPEIVK